MKDWAAIAKEGGKGATWEQSHTAGAVYLIQIDLMQSVVAVRATNH
jgi:hypothetical protein